MAYLWSKGEVFEMKEYFGEGYSHHFFYNNGDYMYWCEDFDDLKRLGSFFLEKFLREQGYLKEVYQNWRKIADEFLKESKKLTEIDLTKRKDEELLQIHQKIYAINQKTVRGYLTDVMQGHLGGVITEKLLKYIPEKGSKFNKYFSILTSPIVLSKASEEEIDILRIAKQSLQNKQGVSEMVKKHSKKYFWLGGNYLGRDCFCEEHFKKRASALSSKSIEKIESEIEKIKKGPSKVKAEKDKAIKELKLDEGFKEIIKTLEEINVFHDQRKEAIVAPIYYRRPLYGEIAKRLGIKREELVWLTPPEIGQALEKNKVDIAELKKRSQKLAFYCDREREIIATGQKADELFERLVKREEVKEIGGTVASTGRVKGTVRIVKVVKDIGKVKKGDILVAGMTTPDYVPAMKRAVAIVTDEGGLTCHAAIVSRELGIPCIIGTKVATQVLKDGQLVEVNANHGVVKVIEE